MCFLMPPDAGERRCEHRVRVGKHRVNPELAGILEQLHRLLVGFVVQAHSGLAHTRMHI